jgi:serine phosphatase RsbU (regulator of sigma subunit)
VGWSLISGIDCWKQNLRSAKFRLLTRFQHSIQPRTSPQIAGIEIEAYWQPFKQVGGDAWGWVTQADKQLTWFILDVAGKGLPAALAAMSLHTAIRMGLQMNLSPSDVLQAVNKVGTVRGHCTTDWSHD